MGMFDYITYGGVQYQTKDTPDQFMSDYEIRGDELWYRKVESNWVPNEETLFGGYLEEVSAEWIFCEKFDGAIRFYAYEKETQVWIEYKALFMDGKMIKIARSEEND